MIGVRILAVGESINFASEPNLISDYLRYCAYLNMRNKMQKSDTVQLKTGGYSTVVFGLESPMVECLWYERGKQCRGEFFIDLLEEVSSSCCLNQKRHRGSKKEGIL
jgi:uncharacterized protein YodC (DUF2158 family)